MQKCSVVLAKHIWLKYCKLSLHSNLTYHVSACWMCLIRVSNICTCSVFIFLILTISWLLCSSSLASSFSELFLHNFWFFSLWCGCCFQPFLSVPWSWRPQQVTLCTLVKPFSSSHLSFSSSPHSVCSPGGEVYLSLSSTDTASYTVSLWDYNVSDC